MAQHRLHRTAVEGHQELSLDSDSDSVYFNNPQGGIADVVLPENPQEVESLLCLLQD